MTGRIVQINISRGGVPKRPIPEGAITPLGLEGDLCEHPEIHGGPRQAVLLIAAETVDELIARGYPLYYGALGENLTTRGLDRRQSRRPHLATLGNERILCFRNRAGPSSHERHYPGGVHISLTEQSRHASACGLFTWVEPLAHNKAYVTPSQIHDAMDAHGSGTRPGRPSRYGRHTRQANS